MELSDVRWRHWQATPRGQERVGAIAIGQTVWTIQGLGKEWEQRKAAYLGYWFVIDEHCRQTHIQKIHRDGDGLGGLSELLPQVFHYTNEHERAHFKLHVIQNPSDNSVNILTIICFCNIIFVWTLFFILFFYVAFVQIVQIIVHALSMYCMHRQPDKHSKLNIWRIR